MSLKRPKSVSHCERSKSVKQSLCAEIGFRPGGSAEVDALLAMTSYIGKFEIPLMIE
jgi:hypothetical protein